jgi:hypothetical protein
MKDRVIEIDDGRYWFLPKFIEFQYGVELNKSNKVHKSVMEILEKYGIFDYRGKTKNSADPKETLRRIGGDPKDKEKEKEKEKDKDKDKDKDKVKDKEKDKDSINEEIEKMNMEGRNNIVNEVVELWNLYCDKSGLSKVKVITDRRRSGILNRLSEKNFNMLECLKKIDQSDFLKGIKKGADWKVTFDWLVLSKNNYIKLLEGNYDNRNNGSGATDEELARISTSRYIRHGN